ncbi:succinate dehydrogenase, hydrophobic membrane anchor protein [Amylibacter marinus]|uniref:Succinate dehydrogenase hydrophobic membrane anchor subunit n=1 Tax=Amylibacter marinus TaxID=1475483 RepID=A0ABQ5VTA9_9RHOB|nr:succinate dehydrogenase, hydrophobic membrane anchor protein [Amylibacter marinus]GLQ34511.1 succinate dehydrogenase, hydrophobic membrane anchor protein [Amylibacter marinus]
MSYKTDKGRVIGLGSAKTGAEHWLGERIKAFALIPLTLAFFCIMAPMIGAPYEQVVATLQNPVKAIALILFFAVTFKHLEEGLQVVIEDYVHGKGAALTLIVLTKLFCWSFGLAAIFAIAKIAFSA